VFLPLEEDAQGPHPHLQRNRPELALLDTFSSLFTLSKKNFYHSKNSNYHRMKLLVKGEQKEI
jgi:hypothetical protein